MKNKLLLAFGLILATAAQAVTLSPTLGQSAASVSQAVALPNEQVQDLNITGQATQTVSGNNIVLATAGSGSTDANGYRSVTLQVLITGTVSSGVVTFEGSNDNTNFQAVPLYDINAPQTAPVTTISPVTATNRAMTGPLVFRYFRARISTVIGGGGSIAAVTRFSQTSFQPVTYQISSSVAANLLATIVANSAINMAQVGGTSAVTAGVGGTLAVGGNVAISAAATTNPLGVGGRVTTTLDTSLTNGDVAAANMTDAGQLITKDYGSAGNDWVYAAATSGIVNTTTAVTVKTAAAASIRNYITSMQIQAEALGTATEVAIRDGAAGTVLWRIKIGTGGLPLTQITFPTPLRGTAATLVEVVTLTASTTGAVYVNLQGYTSF